MREWIAFCFDLGQNFVYVLRDGYEFVELEDLSSVSVMVAGEGDMYWAVKNANLHADDPEVDLYRLDYDENAGSFVHDSLFAPRLTSFVFRHMVTYLSACVPDGGKLVSYNDNTSARLFLRYLTDVFLGADHPLPGPY
jgi:hypothetical protein